VRISNKIKLYLFNRINALTTASHVFTVVNMDLKNDNLGRISLKVVGQDGNEILALIKPNKRMASLKKAFADRLVSFGFVYFTHFKHKVVNCILKFCKGCPCHGFAIFV